jgi:hypothetical protein
LPVLYWVTFIIICFLQPLQKAFLVLGMFTCAAATEATSRGEQQQRRTRPVGLLSNSSRGGGRLLGELQACWDRHQAPDPGPSSCCGRFGCPLLLRCRLLLPTHHRGDCAPERATQGLVKRAFWIRAQNAYWGQKERVNPKPTAFLERNAAPR